MPADELVVAERLDGVVRGHVDLLQHRGEDVRLQVGRHQVVLVGVDADAPHLARLAGFGGGLERTEAGATSGGVDHVSAGLVLRGGDLLALGRVVEAGEVRRLADVVG